MPKLDKNLLKIAKRVRRACEIFAKSDDSSGYDFHGSSDLCCMCGVASFFLKDVCRHDGIILKTHSDNQHCFCEKDGIVIDLTATQFHKKNKVHLTTMERYKKFRYSGSLNKPQVLKSQRRWPKSQKYNKKAKKYLWGIYEKLLTKSEKTVC